MLRIDKKDKGERTIAKSVILLTIAFALRYILGFIIQPLIAYKFGVSSSTDAFIIASMIPTIISDSLVGSVLGIVLVPTLIKLRLNKNEAETERVANTVFTSSIFVLAALSLIYIIFARPLMNLLAPGLPSQAKHEAIIMARMIAPNFLLFFFIIFNKSLLNSYKIFTLPAYSPLLFTLGLFLSIIFASGKIGIYSLALGVVAGGVLQSSILALGIKKLKFKLSFTLFLSHPSVKEIFLLSTPLALYVVTQNINTVIFRFLASGLQEGGIASLNFSDQLMQTIAALFVGGLSAVILPFLSQYAAANEMDKVKKLFILSLKFLLVATIPTAALLWIFAHPLISVLFARGAFDSKAAGLTAMNLKYYVFGFWAFAATVILLQVYYSLGKTKAVYKIGLVTIALNIILAVILSRYLDVNGIALASSITRNFTFFAMLYLLFKEWRIKIITKKTIGFFLKATIASLVTAVFAEKAFLSFEGLALPAIAGKPQAIPLILSGTISALIFFGVSKLVNLREAGEMLKLCKQMLFRKKINAEKKTAIFP